MNSIRPIFKSFTCKTWVEIIKRYEQINLIYVKTVLDKFQCRINPEAQQKPCSSLTLKCVTVWGRVRFTTLFSGAAPGESSQSARWRPFLTQVAPRTSRTCLQRGSNVAVSTSSKAKHRFWPQNTNFSKTAHSGYNNTHWSIQVMWYSFSNIACQSSDQLLTPSMVKDACGVTG